MTIAVDMLVHADVWHTLPGLAERVQHVLDIAAHHAGITDEESCAVSLLFCDDAEMRDLNRNWRGQDKPTNVLSFPSDAPDVAGEAEMLGDIAISHATVAREAVEQGKRLDDHLAHMLTHGLLHLLGYDHETDEDAEEMEDLEREILAALGIADPYADDADPSPTNSHVPD